MTIKKQPSKIDRYIEIQKNCATKEDYYLKLVEASEGGSVIALFELAWCCRKGYGTPIDLELAFKSFQKAADRKFFLAQLELAFCYEFGEGVERDEKKAISIFKRFAKKENAEACYRLGICYSRQENENSFVYFKKGGG